MINIKIYEYEEKEINYLKNIDKKLGREIGRIGKIERKLNPDLFSALISSIIGQQISTKAASTVEKRLRDLVDKINPENINNIDLEKIQKCGMSRRKAEYIKGVSLAEISNIIDFTNLKKLDDEEFIKEITNLSSRKPHP